MESISSSSSSSTSPHLRLHPRFRPTQPLADRIFRALHHHLRLLHRFDSTFFILGATGNVYTVSLTTTPSCTCPDRTISCKHILFVLIRVLGVSVDDICLRLRSLRPCRARQPKALEIEEGTICPICLEEMEKEDRISAVACGSCKNVVHEECLMKWRRSRGRRGASCVICRARWKDRIEQERYLNLAAYVNHGQDEDAGLCFG